MFPDRFSKVLFGISAGCFVSSAIIYIIKAVALGVQYTY